MNVCMHICLYYTKCKICQLCLLKSFAVQLIAISSITHVHNTSKHSGSEKYDPLKIIKIIAYCEAVFFAMIIHGGLATPSANQVGGCNLKENNDITL